MDNEPPRTKRGPKKGFKDTAGRTIQAYKDYLRMAGESRKAQTNENAKMWSLKLKIIARREERKRNCVDVLPLVRTIVPTRETVQCFSQFAPIGVMENFDSDEEGTPSVTEL
jgi:hypothetical protein